MVSGLESAGRTCWTGLGNRRRRRKMIRITTWQQSKGLHFDSFELDFVDSLFSILFNFLIFYRVCGRLYS